MSEPGEDTWGEITSACQTLWGPQSSWELTDCVLQRIMLGLSAFGVKNRKGFHGVPEFFMGTGLRDEQTV